MSYLLLPKGYRNAELLQSRLHSEQEIKWQRRGERRALKLFHEMALRVPAYRDFLASRKFSPNRVKNINDFALIPPIDKDNYLRKYEKHMLCWDGNFSHGQWVISSTSGSTGNPYYFPREASQDWQYAITAELYLRSNFNIQDRSTLYIVAFPMGAWIGGLFTYEAIKIISQNSSYDLSVITPGIHKQEVINAVKQLGHHFDQIIIGAYAPFLKDILDDGRRAGVHWEKYNVGFIFSAEAFSERFRDFVIEECKVDNPLKSTLNHYGTVDLGTMAHETPESILIRRKLVEGAKLKLLFPESNRQPTFAQYNPELFYFEEVSNNLYCTAYSGLPLVRYDLKDYGGVIKGKDVHSKLMNGGIHIDKLIAESKISDTIWNLPFVYVYERNDFSVSYYSFLIYPDTIRRALQSIELKKHVTGKFSMQSDYDKDGRQRLHVHVETKYGVIHEDSLNALIKKSLHDVLVKESSEYREVSRIIGDDAKPIVYLWDYEDPTHFKSGVKQRWVVK
ncbi:MAG: phenylacetate--CoA ligase family protein [Candidatus Saccharimonadales bacterium]